MHKSIADNFQDLNLTLTDVMMTNVEKMVISFEIRGTHPLTLNSQILAVHPIVFTSSDNAALFQVVETTQERVEQAINNSSVINKDHITISSPFNLLCAWLLHLAVVQIPDLPKRHRFMMNIAKYLHYKFFTSLINHYWKHGADEAVMLAAINSLNRKYDIIVYGTWAKTIAARCEDMVSPTSIHMTTYRTGGTDAAFSSNGGLGYVVSDPQTRIRDKLKLVADAYYTFHRQGIKISSSAATTTDMEGEKILVQRASTFDAMVTDLVTNLVNVNTFIDNQMIAQVASQFSATSKDLLKITLIRMSETASRQIATGHFNDQMMDKGQLIHIGMKSLVSAVVLVSFRYCVNNRVPLKNKAMVWNALRNMYSSSRVNDSDITAIKTSVALFIDSIGETNREATKSSLRLAVIMYLIFKCLKWL